MTIDEQEGTTTDYEEEFADWEAEYRAECAINVKQRSRNSKLIKENATLRAQIHALQKDKERLDYMDTELRRIPENKENAYVWAIAAHMRWTLREAIDATREAAEGTK